MPENKTKPTKVRVASFIASVADEGCRADAEALVALMQKVSGETPAMWGPSIIGFGTLHHAYGSGREGDMPVIAFSKRKPALVLYALSGAPGAEALLADIDLKVLEKLVVAAVKPKSVTPKWSAAR